MTHSACFTDARRHTDCCNPPGLTLTCFDVVENIVEHTPALPPKPLTGC